MPHTIIVFEHQTLTEADFRHPADFAYLLEQDFSCFAVQFKNGKLALKSRQYLASIWLPSGMSLEILPKVAQDNDDAISHARVWMTHMMQDLLASKPIASPIQDASFISKKIAQFSDEYQPKHEIQGWIKHLLQAWHYRAASLAIEQGLNFLPKQYLTQAQNQPRASGKLNLPAQLKHNAHRPHYLYSEQQTFDEIKDLKKLLEVAKRMADIQQRHVENSSLQNLQKLAKHWHKRLMQVRGGHGINSQLTSFQLATLRQAVTWARWLLCAESLNSLNLPDVPYVEPTQHLPYPATLIDMNRAFEAWVTIKLQAWANESLPEHRLVAQPSFAWLHDINKTDRSQTIGQLVPDICLQDRQGEFTHVIDAKYKVISQIGDIASTDWQQLFTYQTYLQTEQAWLILPKTADFHQPQCVTTGKQKMWAIPFDVAQARLITNDMP